jgi:DNA repair protein RadC
MAIRDWPEGERPREKLLQKGAASLSDAELLAIFLRTGVKGKSALNVARQMLKDFGPKGPPQCLAGRALRHAGYGSG